MTLKQKRQAMHIRSALKAGYDLELTPDSAHIKRGRHRYSVPFIPALIAANIYDMVII